MLCEEDELLSVVLADFGPVAGVELAKDCGERCGELFVFTCFGEELWGDVIGEVGAIGFAKDVGFAASFDHVLDFFWGHADVAAGGGVDAPCVFAFTFVDVASIGEVVVGGGKFEDAFGFGVVGECLHFLDGAFAEGAGSDEEGAFVVGEGSGDDFRG